MGLRTPAEYLESLKDGRTVYYRGERVDDVTTHPVISKAAKHACVDYEMAEEPEFKDLTIIDDEDEPYARYFKVPRSNDDLLKRSQLIEASTARGKTLVPLVKEIGSDALFGLMRITRAVDQARETSYRARVDDAEVVVGMGLAAGAGDGPTGTAGRASPKRAPQRYRA